jgi:hypothetical protein
MTKPQPSGPTAFYYIYAYYSEDSNDSADLIVEARSKEQAIELWRKYYEFDSDEGVLSNIFRLPLLGGEPGAIPWQDMSVKPTSTEN